MLHEFLDTNRLELATRCRTKVARRSSASSSPTPTRPTPTPMDRESGIPVLIAQMVAVLRAEQLGKPPDPVAGASMERSATHHGRELLQHGFTVDDVVHGYGDLCQAVTELAQEQGEPISVGEFHTFNRCLDTVIADAVTEFSRSRDQVSATDGAQDVRQLGHELRTLVDTITLAYTAIKSGHGAIAGQTGAVIDRSLAGLRELADLALAAARS